LSQFFEAREDKHPGAQVPTGMQKKKTKRVPLVLIATLQPYDVNNWPPKNSTYKPGDLCFVMITNTKHVIDSIRRSILSSFFYFTHATSSTTGCPSVYAETCGR
jgi:hypothetical protein